MDKIQDLASEFTTKAGDKKKLSQVFSGMVELQSQITPNPIFRNSLAERVVALSAMQASSFYILKRQNHLLTGFFASVLMV